MVGVFDSTAADLSLVNHNYNRPMLLTARTLFSFIIKTDQELVQFVLTKFVNLTLLAQCKI